MLLAQTKRPDLLSDLEDNEIRVLAILDAISEKYELDMIQDIILNLLNFRISRDRQGRKELMSLGRQGGQPNQGQDKSLKDMVLGMGSG